MKTEEIILDAARKTHLPGIIWLPESEEIKAIVQVTHDMREHIGRYEGLAEELTAHGIVVAGFDLRGHGHNPGNLECASFGEHGWEASLKDMRLFYKFLEERFPETPHYMLGFSLGSFLVSEYLNRYRDNVAGAVILGTSYQSSFVLSVMRLIVKTQIKNGGFNSTTPLVRKFSLDIHNQKFAPTRTNSDWLCADERQLTSYLLDPYCRDDISSGLFWQLLGSMKRVGNKHAYDKWNKKMPVLLMSGESDPVGDFGKGVKTVEKVMKDAGMKHVTVHLFAGARHDLLHEESSGCAEQVRNMLVEWILKER